MKKRILSLLLAVVTVAAMILPGSITSFASRQNDLSLNLSYRNFTVSATGENEGEGVIAVALYDSEELTELLDVKTFNAKTIPSGSFERDGYAIALWWSSFDDVMPLCKPAKGVVHASEYTVTFNMMGHGEQVSSQTVQYEGKVQYPKRPVAENCAFYGWYLDEYFLNSWDFNSYTVTEETTLYARWLENPTEEYTLNCKILNAGTEEPIEGVPVALEELIKTTDGEGIVEYKVTPGIYNFKIEYDGYKTYMESITVDSDINKTILFRNYITVRMGVPYYGALYDKDGEYAPNSIDVPNGTKVSTTLNTDPTLTFTDPDDGSTINFYTRRTSDLYKFRDWDNVPEGPITEEPAEPILAIWELDLSKLKPLTGYTIYEGDFRYLPVCDLTSGIALPSSVIFYDENYKALPKNSERDQYEMSNLKNAYYYSNTDPTTHFIAVRSINILITYNDIYGEGGTGIKEVNEQFKNDYLFKGEVVESLVESPIAGTEPEDEPLIAGVKISKIWSTYQGVAGFDPAGIGRFWSSVAMSDTDAYFWDQLLLNVKDDCYGGWLDMDRTSTCGINCIVSKEF